MSQNKTTSEEEPQTTIEVSLTELREAWEAKWDQPEKYGQYEDLAKYVTWQDDNPAETVKVTTQETSLHARGWTRVRIRSLIDMSSILQNWEYGATWDDARAGVLNYSDATPEDDNFDEVVRESMMMARDEAWYHIRSNLKTEPRLRGLSSQVRIEYVDDK